MSLDVEVRLDTPGEESPLVRYPELSASTEERLRWYVSGAIRVRSGETTITASPYSNDGYLTDYLWALVLRFADAVATWPSADPVEIRLYDNPGQFRLESVDAGVQVSFDSQTRDRVERAVVVPVDELCEATASAVESLVAALQSVNPELRESEPVLDLERVRERTEKKRRDQS